LPIGAIIGVHSLWPSVRNGNLETRQHTFTLTIHYGIMLVFLSYAMYHVPLTHQQTSNNSKELNAIPGLTHLQYNANIKQNLD
jgi:phenylpropionate dioxygenase-like ring-hydroxylating dioxygenase large terminal subunit